MFAPTPGKFIVAVNAANGAELWRFKPEGKPAEPAAAGNGKEVQLDAVRNQVEALQRQLETLTRQIGEKNTK